MFSVRHALKFKYYITYVNFWIQMINTNAWLSVQHHRKIPAVVFMYTPETSGSKPVGRGPLGNGVERSLQGVFEYTHTHTNIS